MCVHVCICICVDILYQIFNHNYLYIVEFQEALKNIVIFVNI